MEGGIRKMWVGKGGGKGQRSLWFEELCNYSAEATLKTGDQNHNKQTKKMPRKQTRG